MRDPASEEQSHRGSVQIERMVRYVPEENPSVIQRHDHHHQSTKEINRFKPGTGSGGNCRWNRSNLGRWIGSHMEGMPEAKLICNSFPKQFLDSSMRGGTQLVMA